MQKLKYYIDKFIKEDSSFPGRFHLTIDLLFQINMLMSLLEKYHADSASIFKDNNSINTNNIQETLENGQYSSLLSPTSASILSPVNQSSSTQRTFSSSSFGSVSTLPSIGDASSLLYNSSIDKKLERLVMNMKQKEAEEFCKYFHKKLKSVFILKCYSVPKQHKDLHYINISRFSNLVHLHLEAVPPSIIKEFQHIRRTLESIEIENSGITDISQVFLSELYSNHEQGVLNKLKPMILSTQDGTIPEQYQYHRLRLVKLSNCGLSCLDATFHFFPNITSLDLSKNQLSNIMHLQDCYRLKSLNISFNRISVLSNIYLVLGNIKILDLSNNSIQSLHGLDRLISVQKLDLSKNQIDDFHEVFYIIKLPNLKGVDLYENPIAKHKSYRLNVINQFIADGTVMEANRAVPQLDGESMSESEEKVFRGVMFRAIAENQKQISRIDSSFDETNSRQSISSASPFMSPIPNMSRQSFTSNSKIFSPISLMSPKITASDNPCERCDPNLLEGWKLKRKSTRRPQVVDIANCEEELALRLPTMEQIKELNNLSPDSDFIRPKPRRRKEFVIETNNRENVDSNVVSWPIPATPTSTPIPNLDKSTTDFDITTMPMVSISSSLKKESDDKSDSLQHPQKLMDSQSSPQNSPIESPSNNMTISPIIPLSNESSPIKSISPVTFSSTTNSYKKFSKYPTITEDIEYDDKFPSNENSNLSLEVSPIDTSIQIRSELRLNSNEIFHDNQYSFGSDYRGSQENHDDDTKSLLNEDSRETIAFHKIDVQYNDKFINPIEILDDIDKLKLETSKIKSTPQSDNSTFAAISLEDFSQVQAPLPSPIGDSFIDLDIDPEALRMSEMYRESEFLDSSKNNLWKHMYDSKQTYCGTLEHSSLSVIDNLELYFREQVFSTLRPSGSSLYIRYDTSTKPSITNEIEEILFIDPASLANESYIALFHENIIIIDKANTNVDKSNKKALIKSKSMKSDSSNLEEIYDDNEEISVVLVLTNLSLYIVRFDFDENDSNVKFQDAPIPILINVHDIVNLRFCTVFFGFQRCLLTFSRFDSNFIPSNLKAAEAFDDSISYMIISREKTRTYPIITTIPPVANAAREFKYKNMTQTKIRNVQIVNMDSDLLDRVLHIQRELQSKVTGQQASIPLDNDVRHYQLLYQVWRKKPGIQKSRTLIITQGFLILCHENLSSTNVELNVLDYSILSNVSKLQIEQDPTMFTIIFKPLQLFGVKRKWRLKADSSMIIVKLIEECRKLKIGE